MAMPGATRLHGHTPRRTVGRQVQCANCFEIVRRHNGVPSVDNRGYRALAHAVSCTPMPGQRAYQVVLYRLRSSTQVARTRAPRCQPSSVAEFRGPMRCDGGR